MDGMTVHRHFCATLVLDLTSARVAEWAEIPTAMFQSHLKRMEDIIAARKGYKVQVM